jgi:hypothetical protein
MHAYERTCFDVKFLSDLIFGWEVQELSGWA